MTEGTPASQRLLPGWPMRLPVPEFRISDSQKKVLRRNRSALAQCFNTLFDSPDWQAHCVLNDAWYNHHFGFTPSDYAGYADEAPHRFIAIHDTGTDKPLAGVFYDVSGNVMYGRHYYYDIRQKRRSLGTLAILFSIEAARAHHCTYLDMGRWIPDSGFMTAYKTRFQPFEIDLHDAADNRRWIRPDLFFDPEI